VAEPLLEVQGVSKSFASNKALDRVSLSLDRGEVVALLGHNGSGKSTLVKVLSGAYAADEGVVLRRGTRLHFIHQSLGLVPSLTVAENLDIGLPARGFGVLPVNRRRETARVERLIRAFGVRINPDAQVGSLTQAQQTIVAIVRALEGWDGPDNVLVLDEPTAALHDEEVKALMTAIRSLAATGAGVIFISHRLAEVAPLADRAIVLKNGRVVAERMRGAFDQAMLVRLIAGAEPETAAARTEARTSDCVLHVRGLAAKTLRGLTFSVTAGEILGVSGLVGSGMEHLNSLVFGAAAPSAGSVLVGGAPLPTGSPRTSITRGLAYVPADRRRQGSFGRFSARENLTLPRLATLTTRWGAIDSSRERREALDWMDRLGVQPPRQPEQAFELFSGGNQQKIVLAKWLRTQPRVLLVDEPTQGVDVGAQAEIYRLLVDAARQGAAVVVASSDTKELADLCDRVLVLREGRLADEFCGPRLSEAALVAAALQDGNANGGSAVHGG